MSWRRSSWTRGTLMNKDAIVNFWVNERCDCPSDSADKILLDISNRVCYESKTRTYINFWLYAFDHLSWIIQQVHMCRWICNNCSFRGRSSHQLDGAKKRPSRRGTAAEVPVAEVQQVAVNVWREAMRCIITVITREITMELTSYSSSNPFRHLTSSRYWSSLTLRVVAIKEQNFCTNSTGCWIHAKCLTCLRADLASR